MNARGLVVAQRLVGASRQSHTVARLGGDEFVVLAEDVTYIATQELADRLHRSVVAEPIVVDWAVVRLTVSIGCASIDEHCDADVIMSTADGDMYQQKMTAQWSSEHQLRAGDPWSSLSQAAEARAPAAYGARMRT